MPGFCGRILFLALAMAAGCGQTAPSGASHAGAAASSSGEHDARSGGNEAGPPPPDRFTLVAWTLAHFPLTAMTVPKVAATLTDLGADLIGVEEIEDTAAFEQLAAALPGFESVTSEGTDGYSRVG